MIPQGPGENIGDGGEPVRIAEFSAEIRRLAPRSQVAPQQAIVPALRFRLPQCEGLQPGTDILKEHPEPRAAPIEEDRRFRRLVPSDQGIARVRVAMDHDIGGFKRPECPRRTARLATIRRSAG